MDLIQAGFRYMTIYAPTYTMDEPLICARSKPLNAWLAYARSKEVVFLESMVSGSVI
jgi:hypothetical protein